MPLLDPTDDWKDDGLDTPHSTVDDSWPWEDHIQSSPLPQRGKSAKIVLFAHNEYPLERPPILCRMLFDTVPITSIDDQKESFRTNTTTAKSSGKCTDEDLDDDSLINSFRRRSNSVTPLPLVLPSTKITSQDAPPNSNSSSIKSTFGSLKSNNYQGSSSSAVVSPTDGNKHMLSSLVSWWTSSSSSGSLPLHRNVKVTPNGTSTGNHNLSTSKNSFPTKSTRVEVSQDVRRPSTTLPSTPMKSSHEQNDDEAINTRRQEATATTRRQKNTLLPFFGTALATFQNINTTTTNTVTTRHTERNVRSPPPHEHPIQSSVSSLPTVPTRKHVIVGSSKR